MKKEIFNSYLVFYDLRNIWKSVPVWLTLQKGYKNAILNSLASTKT